MIHILSSVRVGVVEDLARSLESHLATTVTVDAALSDDVWRHARSGGVITSVAARIVALMFPFRVIAQRRGPDDIIIATTNPFWLPTALVLRGGRRLIVLVYDVYPDALLARWRLPAVLQWAIAAVVGAGLRRADAVVTLGRRVAGELVERHRLPMPPHVIPTGAHPGDFAAADPTELTMPDLGDGVLISYIGNTGSVHDGATIGEALARVLRIEPQLRAVIATRGDRARELLGPLAGISNADVSAVLDERMYRATMARTDIMLVSLGDRAAIASVPSKVYAALAAGCAVVAVAPPESDLADLVRENGVGFVVAPGDVDGAVEAILALVRDGGARARCGGAALAAAEQFTPSVLAERWTEVLAPLLAEEP